MDPAIMSLIILTVCVILFVTETFPSATTAMLGCVAMVIFKVATLPQVLSGFSGDILLIVFGMQVIGLAMFSSGAAHMIGNIAIKLSANNERRYIFLSCLISAALSAFLSNMAIVAMMIAIAGSIVKISDNMRLKNLVLPAAIGAIYGGCITLVGSTPQLIATGLLEEAGSAGFSMFSLAYLGVPLTLIMLVYVTLIGYPMGKKIWGNDDRNALQGEMQLNSTDGKDNKKAYTVLGIFVIVLVLFFSNLVTTGTAAMIGALLCIISGSITQKEVFAKMDWNVIIWLCSTLGLGNAVNAAGGGNLIADAFLNLFGANASPYILLAAIVFLVMLLSNFMANTTAVVIILPPVLFMVNAMGLNPYPFAYAITFGASLTFALPLANGFVGLSMSAGYKFTDLPKYGLLLSVISYFVIVIFTPMIFPFYI